MKICIVGKFPPIQGGVSAQVYWTARELAKRGHEVHIITNADEVEFGFRQYFRDEDHSHREISTTNGSILVHSTTNLGNKRFIPYANPDTSKLFGLATSVIKEYGCDVIVGWYLEPYGFVAGLIGLATDIPVIIRHAGSDIGRLAKHNELANAYRFVLNRAEKIITSTTLVDYLISLGAKREQIKLGKISKLAPQLRKSSKPLNIREFDAMLTEWIKRSTDDKKIADEITAMNLKLFTDGVIIGIYGKIGITKGNYDLLRALEILAIKGIKFSFVQIPCGTGESLRRYFKRILGSKSLLNNTWIIPPLPPWRIPEFLSLCDATCFLEREFLITFHTPMIPRKILASGSCMILSEEIAKKQVFKTNLVDERNCIIVSDPKDVKNLALKLEKLIKSPELICDIGLHGRYLSQFFEEQLPDNHFVDAIESHK